LYRQPTEMAQRMRHLIAIIEQLTAKVEANTNPWREGDNAFREAAEVV
jgi:hypothetical protein